MNLSYLIKELGILRYHLKLLYYTFSHFMINNSINCIIKILTITIFQSFFSYIYLFIYFLFYFILFFLLLLILNYNILILRYTTFI